MKYSHCFSKKEHADVICSLLHVCHLLQESTRNPGHQEQRPPCWR
uniref:Uncharacterized protein n=1 Tax=Arundo donax TaxID=35708 RepID=A0A0A9C890_ARUDO